MEKSGPFQKDISAEQIKFAKEAFVIGTTLDVLPITKWQSQPISDGKAGSWVVKFNQLIQEDQKKT